MSVIKDRLTDYHDWLKTLEKQYEMLTAKDVLDMIEQLQDDLKQNEKENGWIPVSERLPEESLNSVIGWDEYRKRCVFIQFIDGQFKNCGTEQSFNITLWMPIPEPYKEDEKHETD